MSYGYWTDGVDPCPVEDPDPEPDWVGELPDEPEVDDPELVDDLLIEAAHCVMYSTVTPAPLARIPVPSDPLPYPDHVWFVLVSVAL